MAEHIYPIFDKMLARADKEALLGQHGVMIWFTGLSGSPWSESCTSGASCAASWTGTTSGAASTTT